MCAYQAHVVLRESDLVQAGTRRRIDGAVHPPQHQPDPLTPAELVKALLLKASGEAGARHSDASRWACSGMSSNASSDRGLEPQFGPVVVARFVEKGTVPPPIRPARSPRRPRVALPASYVRGRSSALPARVTACRTASIRPARPEVEEARLPPAPPWSMVVTKRSPESASYPNHRWRSVFGTASREVPSATILPPAPSASERSHRSTGCRSPAVGCSDGSC